MIENNSLEYAGFWRRLLAYLIDSILLSIYFLILIAIFKEAGIVLLLISPPILTILFWVYRQATPGKMLLSMKIIDARSGGKPSVGQCVGRWFAYIPSSLIFCLGYFWIAIDARKQGWHDKLASTVVVRKKVTPVSLPEAVAAQQEPEYAAPRKAPEPAAQQGPEYATRREAQFQAPQEPAG